VDVAGGSEVLVEERGLARSWRADKDDDLGFRRLELGEGAREERDVVRREEGHWSSAALVSASDKARPRREDEREWS
jgi:hypothetical protein